MSDIVISVNEISKSYKLYEKPLDRMKEALSLSHKQYHKEHFALKDVSFCINKGENIGIVGVNGSGKSTLLKILTGVLTQSTGTVEVNGKVSALLELGAGFNQEYTGMENIYLNGTIMGYSKEEMELKVDSIIKFADIGEFINQPVKTYSSGMFARLAFAVAINVEPDILIVDEALSVGDIKFQIKCMDKMKEMIEGGTTVLFVSHDTNAIRRFCSKVLWLNKGEKVDYGETNAVIDKYHDFLKVNDSTEHEIENKELCINKEFRPIDTIAEIVGFNIQNRAGTEVKEIKYDEYLKITVTYDVYDSNITNPVLGVALLAIDDEYMCGLNTLLDEVEIEWKYGRNSLSLVYPNGIRAIGGKYYFNVALFEQTATVPIHYIDKIKELTVISNYCGEGRYIIPHEWKKRHNEGENT